MRKLGNLAAFQVGWFACVLGAAWRVAWLPPVGAALVVGLHLALSPRRGREAAFLTAAAAIGFVVDTTLIIGQAYEPARFIIRAPLCPLWMVLLWASFATTFNGCLRWLRGREAIAGLLGAIGGPLAYYAGHRFGALTLDESLIPVLGLLAVVWAVAVPGLSSLAEQIAGPNGGGTRDTGLSAGS